jgi:sporulation protein YlmC with PRC-barrel domain
MQFRDGTTVFTSDGRDAGELDRVVIDPETREVTAIIVRKGLLFTEDKVIPISLIAEATDERITLREDAGDLDRLPLFEEAHYVPAPGDDLMAAPLYWYPPYPSAGTTWWGFPNYLGYPPYPIETERNIPEGQIALQEGARVVDSNGDTVGEVKQVMTDALADRVTHLLIVRGGLLNYEQKLVPCTWVRQIEEDKVQLRVSSEFLDTLREYPATP